MECTISNTRFEQYGICRLVQCVTINKGYELVVVAMHGRMCQRIAMLQGSRQLHYFVLARTVCPLPPVPHA